MLRDHDYLGDDYAQQAHAMYNHYAPIERNQSLSFRERKAAMNERRGRHFDLLKEKGLSLTHLQRVIDDKHIVMREGYQELFSHLHSQHVPMIIISASGLGTTMIEMMLQHSGVDMIGRCIRYCH